MARFSDAPGSGQRKELIDSRLYRTPHFTADQQAIIANLTAAFVAFRRSEPEGDLVGAPFTLSFCQHDRVDPAFIWCDHTWLPQIYDWGNVKGAPHLVVEFESASAGSDPDSGDSAGHIDRVYAREKRDLYERHWVSEYWRIDVDTRTITIDLYDPSTHRFDAQPVIVRPGERLTMRRLQGFELTTEEVFDRPVAKLTYDDIVRMPPDMLRHELIDGVHFARRAGSVRHQLILGNLLFRVCLHVQERDLGLALPGLDIVFSPHDVANADFTYVSNVRKKAVLTEKHFIGAPDIVFEILGHDTRERDRTVKRGLYERYGVPEYWLLDPQDASVTIYRRPSPDAGFDSPLTFTGSAQLTTPHLPGFEVALGSLFDLRLPDPKDDKS